MTNDPTLVDTTTGEVIPSLFDSPPMVLESPAIDKIAPALLAAQTDIGPIIKEAENEHFRRKYATLHAYLEALRPALAKHDMFIQGSTAPTPTGKHRLLTRVVHTSGQWMGSLWDVSPVKNDPQGEGSALTYARRYQVSTLLSVAAEEDDDGNSASTPQRGGQQRQQQSSTATRRKWLEEAKAIEADESIPLQERRIKLLQLMEACERASQSTPALGRELIRIGTSLKKRIEAETQPQAAAQ